MTDAASGSESARSEPAGGRGEVPLCVDLDGTLLRSDTLVESYFALLQRGLGFVVLAPFWLLRGRARLKAEIASRVDLPVELLPYHEEFVRFLQQERDRGRPLVLVTAAPQRYADRIAAHLGLFDRVVASDESLNLAGARKAERLCELFGKGGFDYAGNSRADLAVWARARRALLVEPGLGVEAAARRQADVTKVFPRERSRLREVGRALRLHQWLKNLLLFAPLVAAHRATDSVLLSHALLGFLAYGLAASGVYLVNDLLDLSSDRRHVAKRHRPFAAGSLPLVWGMGLAPLLILVAVALGLLLSASFAGLVAAYVAIALLYSVRLKRLPLVDVLVLAGLYALRLVAGSVAVSVELSFWLLALAMFLFLSLAMAKRYAELLVLGESDLDAPHGRGYRAIDLDTMMSLGTAGGYIAVLVLALYINSDRILTLYTNPRMVWLLCPLLLFWISRVWLVARRGQLHHDPLIFACRDPASWVVFIAAAGVYLVAM